MKAENKAQMKYSGKLMRYWYWCIVLILCLLLLTAAVLYVDTTAGIIVGSFTAVFFLITFLLDLYYRPRVLMELTDFASHFASMEKEMLEECAFPYGIVQTDGRMLWINRQLAGIIGKKENTHKHISTLIPDIKTADFPIGEEETHREIHIENKIYNVLFRRADMRKLVAELEGVESLQESCYVITIHLFDVTEFHRLQTEKYEQTAVVGLVYMDNYDEVMDSVEDIRRSMLEALVDRRITKYVASMGGLIKKLEKDKYLLVINRKGLDVMEKDRFSILEDVKTVNIGNSINMTISIGIGMNNGDYTQNYEAARATMEMALARGGDQVVVKEAEKITFYGGKTQRAERNTRVRARVKAQALRELINTRDRVIVMGHKMTDIDSLGACVGVCKAAQQIGKPAYIVLGDVGNSLKPWIDKLRRTEPHEEKLFLNHSQAIEKTNHNTVVVVVDTNRPSNVECEELLFLTKSIVVLDHHRQSTDKIEYAALSYVEPSASSACEMIAEILQYYDDDIRLTPTEADCMYAGIIVDTNNFAAKTGMRTFEAAAFLRQSGADMTRVRKAFRNDMKTYKAKAETVRHAEAYMDCYAISECPSADLENPTIVGAQAANELLNIIGVKASFVLTEFDNKVFISARAIDEVNVQIIMERLGGGGHMNIAGAQLPGMTNAEARIRLKEVLTEMVKEGAI